MTRTTIWPLVPVPPGTCATIWLLLQETTRAATRPTLSHPWPEPKPLPWTVIVDPGEAIEGAIWLTVGGPVGAGLLGPPAAEPLLPEDGVLLGGAGAGAGAGA